MADPEIEFARNMPHTNTPGTGVVEKGATLNAVIELAESLRQEKLYISKERSTFYQLSENLAQSCNTVNEVQCNGICTHWTE